MIDNISSCPNCKAALESGAIGRNLMVSWYYDDQLEKSMFTIGSPILRPNISWRPIWKPLKTIVTPAQRCECCGYVIFKGEPTLSSSIFKHPLFRIFLFVFSSMLLAATPILIYLYYHTVNRPPVPEPAKVMGKISSGMGYKYLSDYYDNSHNHPAIWAYSKGGKEEMLVVVGAGMKEEFSMQNSEAAFKAYRELLDDRGYDPE